MPKVIALHRPIWFWWINLEYDRLIISTALEYGTDLTTIDALLFRYPESHNRLT